MKKAIDLHSLFILLLKYPKTFLMFLVMPDLVKDTQLANDSQVIYLESCLFFCYLEHLK